MSAEGGSGGLVAAGAGESEPVVLWPPSLFESREGTDGEKGGTSGRKRAPGYLNQRRAPRS